MLAMPATTRVVPADQPSGASVGVVPQRRAAPAVSAVTARQNYGLLQAKGLSRAGAKMLPRGRAPQQKRDRLSELVSVVGRVALAVSLCLETPSGQGEGAVGPASADMTMTMTTTW